MQAELESPGGREDPSRAKSDGETRRILFKRVQMQHPERAGLRRADEFKNEKTRNRVDPQDPRYKG